MPEEEKLKQEPMVDIDTSGPEVEVNLEEEKQVEEPKETLQVEETEPKEEIKVEEETKEPEVKEETEDKKKELEDYSEGVQKRIAKLTKKWREAERQKEAALSKAREAGDIAAEVEAQKMIARLGVEEARVANLKKKAEAEPKETVKTPTLDQAIAPKSTAPDPKAEEWAEKNPWFGSDSAMTYTAFDLHKKLTEEEGFDAQSDDYYKEIDRRMKLDFPHKFGNTESTVTTKPTQTVASAKRSVNSKSQKTVRLTPSQVTIAKKLGVPLELYAKQLNITKER